MDTKTQTTVPPTTQTTVPPTTQTTVPPTMQTVPPAQTTAFPTTQTSNPKYPQYFLVKQNPNYIMAEFEDRYELYEKTDKGLVKIRTDQKAN